MRILKEHAPTVLLVFLVLLFVMYPLADYLNRTIMRFALEAVYVVVLLSALQAERGGISWRRPGLYAVLLAFLLRALCNALPGKLDEGAYRLLLVGTEIYVALLIFRICYLLLRRLTARGSITADTVAGASAVYILIALAFAALHTAVFVLEPAGTAFNNLQFGRDADALVADSALRAWGPTFTYYSIVTQTTLGYGDITPKSDLARGLAVAQTIIGQLYLAVLLARLVAMELAGRQSRPHD